MKITRIAVHRTALPYVDGVYAWGAGNRIESATATVVVIDTDSGLFAPDEPGLGVRPDFDGLGDPIEVFE